MTDLVDRPVVVAHSASKTVFLSLAPGLLILLFFVFLAPVAAVHSLPSILVLFVLIMLVLVPFELGVLLREGKKLNGKWSPEGVVLFREKMPAVRTIALVLPLLLWCLFVFGFLTSFIDPFMIREFFRWLPSWFFANQIPQPKGAIFIITAIMGFVFNGIIGPIVEELYFRGYLLPRMSRMKAWAPAVNVVLFSVYHFFSPWQNPVRIIALLPLVYVVWWKRNILVGIITHCSLNLLGMIVAFILMPK